MSRRLICGCALLLAISALPASATDSSLVIPSLTESDARTLKSGEYIWKPELAPSGPMLMVVNLRVQRAYVYRNDVLIGVSTISSGKPGHETPTGSFSVLEKERFHRSNKYDNAPMPYMQRLTWYGLAVHGGHLPGHPASHGCVRLPLVFAKDLFKETNTGMKVIITDQPPGGEQVSSNLDAHTGVQSCNAAG